MSSAKIVSFHNNDLHRLVYRIIILLWREEPWIVGDKSEVRLAAGGLPLSIIHEHFFKDKNQGPTVTDELTLQSFLNPIVVIYIISWHIKNANK